MITEETKKNEAIIAEHMIANSLDYHNFDNGQYMLAESDGIWLCNADDTKERKVTADTWIKPYIQECKTHSSFNAAINNRSIAKFTVSENYQHKILIRCMLQHAKALFTVTTADSKTTYEITGYDKRN